MSRPQTSRRTNKFCVECGNKLIPSNKFCGECGTRLDPGPVEEKKVPEVITP